MVRKSAKMMSKLTSIIGCWLTFLVGLATTLTRSMMIGFTDVLPVYILMGLVICMMIYEAFIQKNNKILFPFFYYFYNQFLWLAIL